MTELWHLSQEITFNTNSFSSISDTIFAIKSIEYGKFDVVSTPELLNSIKNSKSFLNLLLRITTDIKENRSSMLITENSTDIEMVRMLLRIYIDPKILEDKLKISIDSITKILNNEETDTKTILEFLYNIKKILQFNIEEKEDKLKMY
jgi:hypothetical protein